jgi:nitrite reductase/ring-hydroxylating ferredoxin subunit
MIRLLHSQQKLIGTTADLATESGRWRELQGECGHLRQVVDEFREADAVCGHLGAARAKAGSIESGARTGEARCAG